MSHFSFLKRLAHSSLFLTFFGIIAAFSLFAFVQQALAQMTDHDHVSTTCRFYNDNGTVNTAKTSAFCDDFNSGPFPGGRGGDLDERKWMFSRASNAENLGQGAFVDWDATPIEFCREKRDGVLAPNDSFMCGPQFGESNHWMEAINGSGGVPYNDAQIRQPFDFANRTGTITFDVDNLSASGHGWWTELWITDEPIPVPQGGSQKPRNGVGINFHGNCGQPTKLGGVAGIVVMKNYQEALSLGGNDSHGIQGEYNGCYTTENDKPNHMEVRINKDKIEVWASDASQDHGVTFPNFKLRSTTTIPLDLNFTRGYVHFEHGQYTPGKDGNPDFRTYHWDNMGFDGPVLPMLRGYSVQDALYLKNPTTMQIGYLLRGTGEICCTTTGGKFTQWTITDVNPASANSAQITLGAWSEGFDGNVQFRFNGKAWHDIAMQRNSDGNTWGQQALVSSVPLSDLVAGNNTLEMKLSKDAALSIANIDLHVYPTGIEPLPNVNVPTVTPMPTNHDHAGTPTPTGSEHNHDGTTPTAVPTPVHEMGKWMGEYFNNRTLTGSPVFTEEYDKLDFNWWWWSPDSLVNRDNFSARWTKMADFEGGTYEFSIRSDDGLKIWVDGKLIYTKWMDQIARNRTVTTEISKGTHTVKIEYYERRGRASAKVEWKLK